VDEFRYGMRSHTEALTALLVTANMWSLFTETSLRRQLVEAQTSSAQVAVAQSLLIKDVLERLDRLEQATRIPLYVTDNFNVPEARILTFGELRFQSKNSRVTQSRIGCYLV
jgi:hypothetical protein